MDKIIDKLAGMGVAGLVLVVVMATTGFAGAAALTAGLSMLGGPFGMLGGVGVLLILSSLSTALAKYGLDTVAESVIQKMIDNGESVSSIRAKIKDFPIISDDMKAKLLQFLSEK